MGGGVQGQPARVPEGPADRPGRGTDVLRHARPVPGAAGAGVPAGDHRPLDHRPAAGRRQAAGARPGAGRADPVRGAVAEQRRYGVGPGRGGHRRGAVVGVRVRGGLHPRRERRLRHAGGAPGVAAAAGAGRGHGGAAGAGRAQRGHRRLQRPAGPAHRTGARPRGHGADRVVDRQVAGAGDPGRRDDRDPVLGVPQRQGQGLSVDHSGQCARPGDLDGRLRRIRGLRGELRVVQQDVRHHGGHRRLPGVAVDQQSGAPAGPGVRRGDRAAAGRRRRRPPRARQARRRAALHHHMGRAGRTPDEGDLTAPVRRARAPTCPLPAPPRACQPRLGRLRRLCVSDR
ncbi:putative Ribonuclease BN [Streptomyces misionensis JCM 4497]